MKKRMLSLILVIAMCLSITVPLSLTSFAVELSSGTELGELLGDGAATDGRTESGLLYAYKDDKAIITGYDGTSTSVEIPASIAGYTVVGLGSYAFWCDQNVKNVTIHADVKKIGYGAFVSSCVESVTLPDGLEEIGFEAFSNCTCLKTINLPDTIKVFGDQAFRDCTNLEIDNLTLANVSIGDVSFSGVKIRSIKLTNCTIGYEAFCENTVLETVSINNCDFQSGSTFKSTTVKSVDLGNITSLPNDMFNSCTFLEQVVLPDGLTWIPNNLFANCTLLTNVYIPASVNGIDEYSFVNDPFIHIYGEVGTTASSFAEENGIPFIEMASGAEMPDPVVGKGTRDGLQYAYCGSEAVITGYTGNSSDLTIPASVDEYTVTGIAFEAFKGNQTIKNVEIGSAVCCISNRAFYGSAIESVLLPNNLNEIGAEAFSECSSLVIENLTLNNTYVGEASFFRTSVKNVSLVSCSVGARAFSENALLESVSMESCIFYGAGDGEQIFSATPVKTVIMSGITNIPYGMFCGCSSLETIVLPDGLISITRSSFANCALLTNVYIPSSTEFIDERAFDGDFFIHIYGEVGTTASSFAEENGIPFIKMASGAEMPDPVVRKGTRDGLQYAYCGGKAVITGYTGNSSDLTIPASVDEYTVTGIAFEAFKGNQTIKNVEIQAIIKKIGNNAFTESEIVTISLPNGIEEISDSAFANCRKLKTINIPETIRYIGDYAFQNCQQLDLKVLNLNDVSIGYKCFGGVDLRDITLSNCKGGESAFYGIETLESVTINNCTLGELVFLGSNVNSLVLRDVKTIPYWAFRGCESIEKIVLPDGIEQISSGAFAECTLLSGVYIPSTVTYIAEDAFFNDQFLFISTDKVGSGESYVETWANKHQIPCITINYEDNAAKEAGEWVGDIDPESLETADPSRGLYIVSKDGQIWFNPEAVANITREKHDNGVHAGWKPVTKKTNSGNSNFDNAIEEVLNRNDKIFNFNLSENEFNLDEKTGKIDFGGENGGGADVTVPVNANLKDVSVYYIDENGNKFKVQSQYDRGTGTVTFHTTHFSFYSIEYIPVTGVILDQSSATLSPGSSVTLVATITPDDATDKDVTWESDNTAVAIVDAAGKVTAVASGKATISVKTEDGEKTANCEVTVSAPDSGGTVIRTKRTLSFETNDGSKIGALTVLSGTMVDLSQYITARDGFTFAGWFSDPLLTKPIRTVRVSSDKTVYAKWDEIPVAFTDVEEGAWYSAGIDFCVRNHLMNGIGDDQFDPNGTTSRGMVAVVLHRIAGTPVVNYAMNFSDVEDGQWYTEAIRWAVATKIFVGNNTEVFGVSDPISREQLAVVLYRFAVANGYDVSKAENTGILSFSDADRISSWAMDEMKYACGISVVTGKPGNRLDPKGTATRAEVASMIQRFCDALAK